MGATKNFTEILQIRTKSMKEQHSRRKAFEGDTSTSRPPRKRGAGGVSGRMLDDADLSSLEQGEAPPASDLESQELAQRDMTDQYLKSRADDVQAIEGNIRELMELYKRLGGLLAEQEELTIRIDQNMDDAVQNMASGEKELVKTLDSVSGSHMLIIKIFAILIAFLIIFVGFIL